MHSYSIFYPHRTPLYSHMSTFVPLCIAIIISYVGTCPLPYRSVGNLLYPPHRREYEDCKQILKLSLNPRTHKAPGKTSASTAVRRLALMGRAVSEDCQPASATLLHSVNPLPFITRFARLNKQRSGDLSLFRSAPKS